MEEDKRNKIKQTMVQINFQVEENLKNNEENNLVLTNIIYYQKLDFINVGLQEKNVYVVKLIEKQKDNKKIEQDSEIYEIYNEHEKLIATVDKQGKMHFVPEYIEALKKIDANYVRRLNLENAIFKLPQELGENDISLQKAEIEEAKEELENGKNNETKQKLEEIEEQTNAKDIEAYSEINTNQTKKFEKITNKQEIDPNAKVTKSEALADMIPEIKEKGFVKIGIVYSDKTKNSNGKFSFVGINEKGQIQPLESLENVEGVTTGQKVTSINSKDGSLIEKEQVAGMSRISGRNVLNGTEEFLSVKVGQYGILEVDYVRRQLNQNKEQAYFSAPVETQNQKPTTKEVKEMMDKHYNTSVEDELSKANLGIAEHGKTRIENIDNVASNDKIGIDDTIVLDDGKTITTIRKEALKARVSPDEFLNKYEKLGGKTPEKTIIAVHEEIEEEYIGSNERKI